MTPEQYMAATAGTLAQDVASGAVDPVTNRVFEAL